jgi:hypothetical protein
MLHNGTCSFATALLRDILLHELFLFCCLQSDFFLCLHSWSFVSVVAWSCSPATNHQCHQLCRYRYRYGESSKTFEVGLMFRIPRLATETACQLHLITHQYLGNSKRLARFGDAECFPLDAFHILYIFGAPWGSQSGLDTSQDLTCRPVWTNRERFRGPVCPSYELRRLSQQRRAYGHLWKSLKRTDISDIALHWAAVDAPSRYLCFGLRSSASLHKFLTLGHRLEFREVLHTPRYHRQWPVYRIIP